jgi:hypothetical protein
MREGQLLIVVCLIVGVAEIRVVSRQAQPEDEAIRRAIALLPNRPEKAVVVDVDNTAVLHEKLGRSEAFVTDGLRVVYVRKQGRTLQLSIKKGGIFDFALAGIIWHEMAHLDGADEPAARRKEEELWMQFIVQHRVDSVAGLQYLGDIRGH